MSALFRWPVHTISAIRGVLNRNISTNASPLAGIGNTSVRLNVEGGGVMVAAKKSKPVGGKEK